MYENRYALNEVTGIVCIATSNDRWSTVYREWARAAEEHGAAHCGKAMPLPSGNSLFGGSPGTVHGEYIAIGALEARSRLNMQAPR
jgi:hypothetical protein